MDQRIQLHNTDRLQQAAGSENIRIECIDRRCEACQRIALSCQMENIVRFHPLQHADQGRHIVQIPILYKHTVAAVDTPEQMGDIIHWAAPPLHSVNIPIRMLQQIIRKVGAHHTRHAGNQCFLAHYLFPLLRCALLILFHINFRRVV